MVKKYNKGDKVRFENDRLHLSKPDYYPPPGTIGTVEHGYTNNRLMLVRWEEGSCAEDCRWLCSVDDVVPAEEEE